MCSPGIKATISLPVDKRTITHFRFAELGFFGFRITVCMTTPFANGFPSKGFFFFLYFLYGPNRCNLLNDDPSLICKPNLI